MLGPIYVGRWARRRSGSFGQNKVGAFGQVCRKSCNLRTDRSIDLRKYSFDRVVLMLEDCVHFCLIVSQAFRAHLCLWRSFFQNEIVLQCSNVFLLTIIDITGDWCESGRDASHGIHPTSIPPRSFVTLLLSGRNKDILGCGYTLIRELCATCVMYTCYTCHLCAPINCLIEFEYYLVSYFSCTRLFVCLLVWCWCVYENFIPWDTESFPPWDPPDVMLKKVFCR